MRISRCYIKKRKKAVVKQELYVCPLCSRYCGAAASVCGKCRVQSILLE